MHFLNVALCALLATASPAVAGSSKGAGSAALVIQPQDVTDCSTSGTPSPYGQLILKAGASGAPGPCQNLKKPSSPTPPSNSTVGFARKGSNVAGCTLYAWSEKGCAGSAEEFTTSNTRACYVGLVDSPPNYSYQLACPSS